MTLRMLLVLLSVFAFSSTQAQVKVSKGGGQKSSIDLSGFRAGDAAATTFLRTLENDLLKSGWFVKGAAGQAEYTISGIAQGSGTVSAECRVTGRATGKQFLNKVYRAELNQARRMAHQAADEIVLALTGRKGLASARLAMVGNRTGSKELYLTDSDGEGLMQLTRDKSVSIAPSWSPDGKKIVYTSYLKRYPDVFMIDLPTGDRKRISGYPGLNTGAAFSPDGREVALILSKDGNPELYLKNLASGALTRLTRTENGAEASPSWSPDGSRIVYVSDQSRTPQLYIISRNGGSPKRITSRGSQNVSPDWGANGWIAYSSLVGRFQVCIMHPDTLETRQISPGDADYEDPSWAPDGRHLACARSVRYASRVYLLDTMGDPPVVLTDYNGDWSSPAWTSGK